MASEINTFILQMNKRRIREVKQSIQNSNGRLSVKDTFSYTIGEFLNNVSETL